MNDDPITLTQARTRQDEKEKAEVWALVVLWSACQPERIGEVGLISEKSTQWVLGRAPRSPGASLNPACQPLGFFRQRPKGCPDAQEEHEGIAEFEGEHISRRQILLAPRGATLHMQNVGKCQVLVNGTPQDQCALLAGDVIHLRDQLLLLCQKRPQVLPPLRHYPAARLGRFGQPDQDGMVGEGPAMWKLRERIAAFAATQHHVLIIGESGTGKELAAQALHRLSPRAAKRMVADNVSTLPPSLAAALLFGNRRNFPNPGMEERVGLIGAAQDSTLFLDEIGDMPEEVQPMFLRVAERGEYIRLGEENRVQRVNFRLIGATNRPERMRYELKRRFTREIRLPGLPARREDITLLVRYLLREQSQTEGPDAGCYLQVGQPKVSPLLIEQMVRRDYQTHIAEIGFILGKAMADASSDTLMPRSSVVGTVNRAAPEQAPICDQLATRPDEELRRADLGRPGLMRQPRS